MGKLFDIKNNNFGNEPTDEEIDFISAYLEKLFLTTECIDFSTKTSEERQTIFSTICSVKNAIADLLSPDGGNYHKLLIGLNNAINFENRLSSIIEELSKYMSGEEKLVEDDGTKSINEVHNPSYGYRTFELNEYLNRLIQIKPLQDEEIEINTNQKQIFNYLTDYLNHILIKYSSGHKNLNKKESNHMDLPLVFLLRDTLLLYLGARRLQSKGKSIDVRAALINRKLIQSFELREGKTSIYKKLYNSIFHLLNGYQGKFSNEFIEQYKELFSGDISQNETQLANFIVKYLNEVIGKKNNFIAVDTAAHGTMALLAHVATGRLSSLEMFTSTPWLYEFYSSNIFRNNFLNIRILESLVCQEELFQFAYISEGRIYINETRDPAILSKAKLEIGIFLNIVDKNIHLT